MPAPQLTVEGNVTGDPELRFTPQGDAVVNFSVACNDRKFNRDTQQWEDGDTVFLRCSAWRQMAENIAESIQRGTSVVITGNLKVREYQSDGQTRVSVECDVKTIGPSLRNASARVQKMQRSGPQQGGQQAPQQGGYQQGPPPQQAPQQGYQQGPPPQQGGGYQQAPAPQQQPPQQQGWGGGGYQDEPPF